VALLLAALPAIWLALLAGPSSAFAASHPRPATPPLHVHGAATAGYVSGYQPRQILHAYQIDQLVCAAAATCGAGQTIGIVDAYDDPTIEADLQTFDLQFGLPACTVANGCLTKATAQGAPATDAVWAREIALDVEWAHAMAPGARILLVESVDRLNNNLFGAVDYAVAHGASVISMSWGTPEASDENLDDRHFNVAGVSFTAASGDKGTGVQYPAASPYVIGVGGTSLPLDAQGGLTGPETAWSGSGGGASQYEALPSYQAKFGIATATRAVPDVSYQGDPSTGVAVFDSTPVNGVSGWYELGGTSSGAPQWAGLLADANALRSSPLSAIDSILYQAATGSAYSNDYRDIISGTNGTCGTACSAAPGYDMVTGLGSPIASGLIPFLAPATAPTASPTPTPTTTPIATPAPVTTTRTGMGYTLDAYGGLYPASGAPPFYSGMMWPNWNIARSAAIFADGSGGYVLDGYGGLHPFGAAPAPVGAPYFPGFDIARDVALLPGASRVRAQGYVLDGWGGLHPFGGAPPTWGAGYWKNWDIAKRVALLSDGTGGYVLDGWGGLHVFAIGSNPMPPAITNSGYWPNWNIARDIALTPGSTASNVSGVTLDGWGGVHPFGAAGPVTMLSGFWPNWDIARAVSMSASSTAAHPMGWVLDGWGGLHQFGGAPLVQAGAFWPNHDVAKQLLMQ
jgi:hypothetical protein